jgi:hypothetical protein
MGTTLEGACVPCDARHTQGLTKLETSKNLGESDVI